MPVTIRNSFVTYVIGEDGRNLAFTPGSEGDSRPGVAVPGEPCAFVRTAEGEAPATSAAMDGGVLTLTFPGAVARVGVTDRGTYTELAVESLEGDGVEALVFPHVPLRTKGEPGEPFAACLLALNLQANVRELPQPASLLRGESFAKFGFAGARFAIAAAPSDRLRDVLKDVGGHITEMRTSPIGGPWAMDAEISRGSYLFNFSDLTEETVDDWIACAKGTGLNQIDFHGGNSFRFGDCMPNPEMYPNGIESLKAVVGRLHDAGIAAGLHTYAFFIDKRCPWVTPVPDPRLAKDRYLTLAKPLDASSDTVYVEESTEDMSAVTGFFVRNSNTLHVGDELITYTGVRTEAPWGFTGCERGAHGTKASAHGGGAEVGHLKECFGLFVPDPETTLFGEVAGKAAETANTCGFDMTYMDALDGEDILGGGEWGWHYGSKYVFEFYDRVDHPVLFEASTFHHHIWWVRSRYGAWDYPFRSDKRFIDTHVESNRGAARMFLPANLGWWSIKTWNGVNFEPSFRDNIEYLCCKALGSDTGLSIMGINPETMKRAVFKRLGGIISTYEALRREGHFAEDVKERLRQPGAEFTLDQESDGEWSFRPVACSTFKATEGQPAAAVENPHPRQPARVRIEALHSVVDGEDTGQPIVSIDADTVSPAVESAPGVEAGWHTEHAEGDRTGPALSLTAARSEGDDGGPWAKFSWTFDPTLDMSERRALGVWIHGDGGGEVMAVELAAPSHVAEGHASFLVDVDFTGWRWFELVEPDSARLDDYAWPTGGGYAIYRASLRHEQIERVSVWYNGLKPGQRAECMIGPIVAMPVSESGFRHPALSINGRETVFPVSMPIGSYLEAEEDGSCILYDKDGSEICEPTLEGHVPVLDEGRNSVEFFARTEGEGTPRARITLVSRGEPFS